MHPQSPALTIGGNVLKESEDLAIWGMVFDLDDFREASSQGFQRSFSKAWYLDEVLAGIPK